MSTLAGRRVTDLDGMIPPAGGFVFTGHLESGPTLAAGPATLVMGDLSLVGAVQPNRGGEDSPDHPAFVFAGGAGWRALLPAPGAALASPSTVRLSTVLSLLVATSGEAYDAPPEAKLGTGYGWDAGTPADAVLADLVARGAVPTWRVQPNGRTSFTPWPALPAADAKGTITDRRLARGVREVALTTNVAAFLPGATLQGKTIARVQFIERGEELRALCWDASDLGPLERWRRLCLKVLPWLARFGLDPATGNLFVRAADTRIDLAGGGPGVLRTSDTGGRLLLDPGVPGTKPAVLYYSPSATADYAIVATIPAGTGGAPTWPGASPGTTVSLGPGSGKVTCG